MATAEKKVRKSASEVKKVAKKRKYKKAVTAAKAFLKTTETLLDKGCIGHLPEILDGDSPHNQRGCDAQAWSATETIRVWKWLKNLKTLDNC